MGIFFESSFEGVGGGKYMYIPLNSYIFSKTSKVKVGLLTHFFGKSLFEIYKFEDKIAKPILLTNLSWLFAGDRFANRFQHMSLGQVALVGLGRTRVVLDFAAGSTTGGGRTHDSQP